MFNWSLRRVPTFDQDKDVRKHQRVVDTIKEWVDSLPHHDSLYGLHHWWDEDTPRSECCIEKAYEVQVKVNIPSILGV